jgi:hypothetical protein
MVRNSVRMARTSLGAAAPVKDAETGATVSAHEALAKMQTTIAQIETVARMAPAAEREKIQAQLEAVRKTAERMAAIDRQMRLEAEAKSRGHH